MKVKPRFFPIFIMSFALMSACSGGGGSGIDGVEVSSDEDPTIGWNAPAGPATGDDEASEESLSDGRRVAPLPPRSRDTGEKTIELKTSELKAAVIGVTYRQVVRATACHDGCEWSVEGLPSGLEWEAKSNRRSIVLSGTPAEIGIFNVHVGVAEVAKEYTLVVSDKIAVNVYEYRDDGRWELVSRGDSGEAIPRASAVAIRLDAVAHGDGLTWAGGDDIVLTRCNPLKIMQNRYIQERMVEAADGAAAGVRDGACRLLRGLIPTPGRNGSCPQPSATASPPPADERQLAEEEGGRGECEAELPSMQEGGISSRRYLVPRNRIRSDEEHADVMVSVRDDADNAEEIKFSEIVLQPFLCDVPFTVAARGEAETTVLLTPERTSGSVGGRFEIVGGRGTYRWAFSEIGWQPEDGIAAGDEPGKKHVVLEKAETPSEDQKALNAYLSYEVDPATTEAIDSTVVYAVSATNECGKSVRVPLAVHFQRDGSAPVAENLARGSSGGDGIYTKTTKKFVEVAEKGKEVLDDMARGGGRLAKRIVDFVW